jgi:hypothetical protein
VAQAQAQADGGGEVQSTAKTTFGGVTVQSTAGGNITGDTIAIAQGGSGQPLVDPEQFAVFAASTALPINTYATTLIGSASNVGDALLGPGEKIFGTAILGIDGSSTFDFGFRGDLMLGVITGGFLNITANGIDILSGEVDDDSVMNLVDQI